MASEGTGSGSGGRPVGSTRDVGFQVGHRRTLPIGVDEAWDLIVSRPALWLGEEADPDFEEGGAYEVPPGPDGVSYAGEIRVFKPGDRLRMTWRPSDWAAPATLQIALTATGPGKTAVTFHAEKLPDAEAREAVRERFREAADRLEGATPT